jgi:hypothetical protein
VKRPAKERDPVRGATPARDYEIGDEVFFSFAGTAGKGLFIGQLREDATCLVLAVSGHPGLAIPVSCCSPTGDVDVRLSDRGRLPKRYIAAAGCAAYLFRMLGRHPSPEVPGGEGLASPRRVAFAAVTGPRTERQARRGLLGSGTLYCWISAALVRQACIYSTSAYNHVWSEPRDDWCRGGDARRSLLGLRIARDTSCWTTLNVPLALAKAVRMSPTI